VDIEAVKLHPIDLKSIYCNSRRNISKALNVFLAKNHGNFHINGKNGITVLKN
jgi:hypothetical protein